MHDQRLINSRQLEEIKLLNEKLHSETRRVKSLERESDRLRSEISLLEAKVGGLVLSQGTVVHNCIAHIFNIMSSSFIISVTCYCCITVGVQILVFTLHSDFLDFVFPLAGSR